MKCLTRNLEVNYPCSPACPLFGDCVAVFLDEQKKQVRPNADRIRAMRDEELSRQFGAQCPKTVKRVCDKRCHLCWLEWLQQPAEEDIK